MGTPSDPTDKQMTRIDTHKTVRVLSILIVGRQSRKFPDSGLGTQISGPVVSRSWLIPIPWKIDKVYKVLSSFFRILLSLQHLLCLRILLLKVIFTLWVWARLLIFLSLQRVWISLILGFYFCLSLRVLCQEDIGTWSPWMIWIALFGFAGKLGSHNLVYNSTFGL